MYMYKLPLRSYVGSSWDDLWNVEWPQIRHNITNDRCLSGLAGFIRSVSCTYMSFPFSYTQCSSTSFAWILTFPSRCDITKSILMQVYLCPTWRNGLFRLIHVEERVFFIAGELIILKLIYSCSFLLEAMYIISCIVKLISRWKQTFAQVRSSKMISLEGKKKHVEDQFDPFTLEIMNCEDKCDVLARI